MPAHKPDDVSQEAWDAVASPPLADDFIAAMCPARTRASAKQLVSLRLDRDVIERFRQGGEGWQTRINEALRKAVGLP